MPRRFLSPLLLSVLSLLSIAVPSGAAAASPPDAAGPPTTLEVLGQFPDQWGRYGFNRPATKAWTQIAAWRRVDLFQFDPFPTADETTGEVRYFDRAQLLLKVIAVFARSTGDGRREYELTENVAPIIGGPLDRINRFPVFAGGPESFVFHNAQALLGQGWEYEEACRGLTNAGHRFLACRTIRHQPAEDAFWYQVFIPDGGDETALPSAAQVLARFADQFGRRSFPLTNLSSWVETARWDRVAEFSLRTGPADLDRLPAKQVRVFQRQNPQGTIVEYGVTEEEARSAEPGAVRDTNPFPIFVDRGAPDRFVFYNSLFAAPPTRRETEQTCRTYRKLEVDYLLCRVIRLPEREVVYQTYRAAAAGPA